MQYEDTIEIRGVTVVRQTDGVPLCRMGNQHRRLAPTQLQPESTVAREDDVGITSSSSGRSPSGTAWSPSKGSMTDPLAVGTGITFSDVPMAGDTGLKYLVNEHAIPSLLAPGGERRRVVPSPARRARHPHAARHEPGAGVNFTDRYSLLRERMIGLLRSRLLLLGILVAPLVIAGYVGLTVLLFLPLLGLRRMFPRRPESSLIRWDSSTPLDSGVENVWDVKTRRA